jgi:hypothetical protein
MQYFKKGLVVAAKKRKCLQNKMKVEIFQLIMNIPIAIPTIAALNKLTFPRYSGARNNESAPNVFMKVPFTVLNMMNQNNNSTWYFLKCRNTNCMGKEYQNPFSQVFISREVVLLKVGINGFFFK